MEKRDILKYIIISGIIVLIYLIIDYFNILGCISRNLNFDAFAILMNALVVVFVFLITYSLVNKKTFELEQESSNNKMNLLNILLKETYRYCRDNLDVLNDDETLKLYIIPKVDFNQTSDKITENLKGLPFQNEKHIIKLFSSGIAQDNLIKEYFEIKKLYQKYVNMRITFFDIKEHRNTEKIDILYNLLNKDKENLESKLNKVLE